MKGLAMVVEDRWAYEFPTLSVDMLHTEQYIGGYPSASWANKNVAVYDGVFSQHPYGCLTVYDEIPPKAPS